jgi:N-acetylmuramoyl-L-alanine amidase
VVIDAAHGGRDTGARITPNLLEKDITLSLARKVRQELQTRHIATEMLRDADNDLALDQRAVITNLARPSVFITLHAEPASTLRIYTPAPPSLPAGALDRSGFLPWQSAQSAFSGDSASLAAVVAEAMSKRELTSHVSPAFLQPLHSIAAPAIAIEAPADKNGLKVSGDLIAGAVADAVAVRKLSAGATQ